METLYPGSTQARLLQLLSLLTARRVQALQATTVPLAAGGIVVEPSVLTLLVQVCRDSERLQFGYTDRAGHVSTRHVEPHRLVSTGRRWYLVARDVDRADWRSFRLDRLRDLQPTGRQCPPCTSRRSTSRSHRSSHPSYANAAPRWPNDSATRLPQPLNKDDSTTATVPRGTGSLTD